MSTKIVVKCPMCNSTITMTKENFEKLHDTPEFWHCDVCNTDFIPMKNVVKVDFEDEDKWYKPDEFTYIKWTQIVCVCFLLNLLPMAFNGNRIVTSICTGLFALIIMTFWEGMMKIYKERK